MQSIFSLLRINYCNLIFLPLTYGNFTKHPCCSTIYIFLRKLNYFAFENTTEFVWFLKTYIYYTKNSTKSFWYFSLIVCQVKQMRFTKSFDFHLKIKTPNDWRKRKHMNLNSANSFYSLKNFPHIHILSRTAPSMNVTVKNVLLFKIPLQAIYYKNKVLKWPIFCAFAVYTCRCSE